MATKEKLQLEIQNLEYSRFVKDQVLTEGQLNEIIDFFEDQHRLTRTCLIGTGIVCGLHLKRYSKSVALSEGVAVTTDGDLFKVSYTNYKYFTPYVQADEGKYDPFYYKQGTTQKAVTLYQLLTEQEKEKTTSAEIYSVEELDSKITNWVGLLYLDYYLKTPERCTPTSCDNLGQRQIARPMLLMISKSDLDKVVQLDTGEVIGDDLYLKYYEAYEKYFTFPVIKPRRVILNDANTLSSNTLSGAYFNAAKNGSSALSEAISKLYDVFKFLIDHDNSVNISSLVSKLNTNLNTAVSPLHAQYTYDYYKDIVTAYNELRDAVYSVAFECVPNLYAFPKHIMLGEPNIDYGPKPPQYRHQFYPSPAVSDHKHLVNKSIGMLDRLMKMVLYFNPGAVDKIKITPSPDYDKPLENRAIPFYYSKFESLAKSWSYSKTLKATDKLNLSYNADQYSQPVTDDVINPLDYSIDEYNFFRIEGHIGKDYKTALSQIDELKNKKGIPIDVVAVRLGDPKLSDINLADFECQFEDLKTILQAFQVEINCILAKGSGFFSGFTAKPQAPHADLSRYNVEASGISRWIINENILNTNIKSEFLTDRAKAAYNFSRTAATADEPIKEATANVSATTKPIVSFCDRFISPVYKINQAVKLNIDEHPDSFGKYYLKVLEKDSEIQADEFVEKARLYAASDPEVNTLNEDERFAVFEYPTQIIANLNVMQRFVPGDVTQITPTFITNYRSFSQNFCTRLTVIRTRLEKYFRTGQYNSRGFESEYLSMIDQLTRLCCGNEKLEVVMREIERRKALILQNLSFSKYAAQHPGLEHKAGSHRGGTFVLVYAGTAQKASVQPTFIPPPVRNLTVLSDNTTAHAATTPLAYKDIDSFALHVVTKDETINRNDELDKFFTLNNIVQGSAYSEYVVKELNSRITNISAVICKQISQPAADLVIADFCLPYLCCSKCPPVAFVIDHQKPAEPISLSLPVNEICNTANPLIFTVTPENGTIATKDAAMAATVKLQADGSTLFDPTALSFTGDQIHISVGFTVNDTDTSCSITVFKHPDAAIHHVLVSDHIILSHVAMPTDSPLNKQITLAFTANPKNETESFTYNWKFGDGQTASGKQVVISFDKIALANSQQYTIRAELTVTNGPCVATSGTSVDYIPYAAPQLALPQSKVCMNQGQIAFTSYSPNGLPIQSPEAPDAVIMAAPPVFDTTKVPANILPATITFTVGGQPTNCIIQVMKPLNLLLSGKITNSNNSVLTISYSNTTDETSIGKQTYVWNFGKAHSQVETVSTGDLTVDFNVKLLLKLNLDSITATVTIKGDVCNSIGTVKNEVPHTTVNTDCQKLVTDFINKKLLVMRSTEMRNRVKEANNVQVTSIYRSTLSILLNADDVFNSGDANKKTDLIQQITEIIGQIINLPQPAFKISDFIARILEELLRALIMLMLNLMRCDNDIDAKQSGMIQELISTFHGNVQILLVNYPQLDLQNMLENDVRDFRKNFASQLEELKKSLNSLIDDLGKFNQ